MSERNTEEPRSEGSDQDTQWSYRGYRVESGGFVTAMVHFYRGEISRANIWRSRLDTTTNWAVVTAGAVITFSFGAAVETHVVILLGMFLILLFLMMESRRYRYYELWALRVRLMETDFYATLLSPSFTPHQEWATRLVNSLLTPEFPINFWEAVGRRLRRNYIWLFLVLVVAWTLKLILAPTAVATFSSFLEHASVGFIPGSIVATFVVGFFGTMLLISLLTAGLRASPGEVLSDRELLGAPAEFLQSLAGVARELPFVHKRRQMVIVITERPKEVSKSLLTLLKRGVTSLEGTGMYSGRKRSVLFCAVEPSEIPSMKSAVYATDEDAFVVVNPAEEIWGGGFEDLRPRWRRGDPKST